MFGALIRRNVAARLDDEAAFDSATFSLTTDVPRPAERRMEERLLVLLPAGKMIGEDWQDLCRIRNISAGGLMAELSSSRDADQPVTVEINSSQHIDGRIVWTRGATVGVKFDRDVDIREVLANRRPRIGFRPRPARLDVRCGATVRIDGFYHQVEVRDISQGGMKVDLAAHHPVGKSVVVTVESLRPIKGTIRWHKDGQAGIVFHRPIAFEELAEWLGKRIEVASLRAGSVTRPG